MSVDPLVGQKFVLDRWAELAAEAPPWWARGDGIGLRLRVEEMREVAAYWDRGNLTNKKTIEWLFEDGLAAFASGTYADKHCRAAAQMVTGDLTKTEPGVYKPGEKYDGTLVALLNLLNQQQYRDELLANIARASSRCGWHSGRLDELDELVTLFDAEFIADRHSPAWRRKVAGQATAIWDNGARPLDEAIGEALDANRHDVNPRDFDVVIPVVIRRNPSGSASFAAADMNEASGSRFPDYARLTGENEIREWGAGGVAILEQDAFAQTNRFFRYRLVAADAEAAAAAANDQFLEDAALWRLLDGELEDPHQAAVRDSAAPPVVDVYRLPPQPLGLAPPELENATPNVQKLDDAIAQIAQARTASEGAALVDLWTAVEALYGDSEHGDIDAGFTIVELTPFPYVRHVTEWLGAALQRHGYGVPPAGQAMPWLHTTVLADRAAVVKLLETNRDPLTWRRLNGVFDWEPGKGLADEARQLRARYKDVVRRTYMIRNIAVHGAQTKACTRSVTLPLFADLVRVTLGHVLRYAGADGALAEVRTATLALNDVAMRWEDGGYDRDAGLKRILYR
jgi:hypothetical protein